MTDQEPIERLRTALADRYEVEQELGHGGMAIVYLARDIKHDRMVAIKVMRPDLAAAIGSERFLREIAIEAKLSHPHILPLYDSGDADGLLYYVMPFVEGESVRDMLNREQQLPLEDAVRIAREVAEALNHAHSYGIIHRDIKPANIMLSGGHAVVSDFGIARALSVAGGESLTQTGTSMGTPAYMSPEQATGDQHIDGRTDVYSLGCVLYELMVGQPPFTGPTAQAVMARHTMDAVTPPSIMRDTIPEELEDIVLRAMAKSPADRFRTAGDMAEALEDATSGGHAIRRHTTRGVTSGQRVRPGRRRTWALIAPLVAVAIAAVGTLSVVVWRAQSSGGGAAESGLDPRSVAVLYFDDLSADGSLAHVADGFTEGLIAQLATVRALDVVSRNGVAPYRGSGLPRDSIARALSVGSVIGGTLEPAGDDLRVTVRIYEGASGAEFDRASFDLPVGELLAAQDSVIAETSRLLRRRLGDEVILRERRASTTSVEAWSLVLRGEQVRKQAETLFAEGDVDGAVAALMNADSLFASAESADGSWAEPAVMRARVADRVARIVEIEREALEWLQQAIGHANRALSLEPGSAAAFEVRGSTQYYHWYRHRPSNREDADRLFASARADLEQAVQIDASLAGVHNTLSHVYDQAGDFTSSIVEARRAYEEDSYLRYADGILSRLFWSLYNLEQHTQALEWCLEGHRRFPQQARFVECQLWMMTAGAVEPVVDRAWSLMDQMVALTPEPDREFASHQARVIVGGVLARAGLTDSARSVLVSARAEPGLDPFLGLVRDEAYMRILLGDEDEAIDLLKRFFAATPEEDHGEGESGELYWWWRSLQDHPRFHELTRG